MSDPEPRGDEVAAQRSAPKRRRGLGLLQWLLLMLVAGVWLAVVVVRWTLDDLRAQVIAMRGEAGFLVLEDPRHVYALRRRSLIPDTSLWRVHVPDEPAFALRLATRQIPQRHPELADPEQEIPLAPGEHSVLLKVQESSEDKSATVQVLVDDEVAMTVETEAEWSGGGWSSSEEASLDRQVAKPASQPLLLINRRNMVEQPGGSSRSPDGAARGIQLWIETAGEGQETP